MKMFSFGDLAVRLHRINYVRRRIDNLGIENIYCIEIFLIGDTKAIQVNCKDIDERDALFKVLIDQIEDEDK
jgi:hypothetical protein